MRGCRNQVVDQGMKSELFFCLVLKEYLSKCPSKCPYLIVGVSLSFEEMYEINLDIECIYFQQLILNEGSKDCKFICTINNESQMCNQCPLITSEEEKKSELFSP